MQFFLSSIVKLGFTGVYISFLNFALNHKLWVLVRAASAVLTYTYKINVSSKNKKNITFCHLKIIIFTAVKNRCILHGCVIVREGFLSTSFYFDI